MGSLFALIFWTPLEEVKCLSQKEPGAKLFQDLSEGQRTFVRQRDDRSKPLIGNRLINACREYV